MMNRTLTALILIYALAPVAAPAEASNVFTEKHCSDCHSLEQPQPGKIDTTRTALSAQESMLDFAAGMWNHGPDMFRKSKESGIPVTQLTATDVEQLSSFLAAFRSHQETSRMKGDPQKGELIWKGMKCSACHALNGETGRIGPNLQMDQELTATGMGRAMWNHGPKMTESMSAHGIKIPRLTGKDMLDLISFLKHRTGKVQPGIFEARGDSGRGRKIFQGKQCTACHDLSSGIRFSARSGDTGDYGMAAALWNHSVGMREEMTQAGVGFPKIEQTEMADLIAFLYLNSYAAEKGNPGLGRRLFESRKCGACHQTGSAMPAVTTTAAFVAGMWNHLPSMAAQLEKSGTSYPHVNPGEMKHIVAYLQKP